MKAVLQRVRSASVTVGGQTVGRIGKGLLVLLGVERGDGPGELDWMARKVAELRMFPDADGKMNLSVEDAGGEALVVSQFTLCADCRKGRRPGFGNACEPEQAERMYEEFVARLCDRGLGVETGEFAAMMDVELVNTGPVTFILESPRNE
ncbi:MAG: D-aminoacyl-tRNA deacylase [Planctomycetota bacterium]